MGSLLMAAGPGALLGLVVALALRRRPFRATLALCAGAVLVVSAAAAIRPDHRYAIWKDAVHATSYDPHPTDENASAAWPIWQMLDDGPSRRIAYVAGWDRHGHNWYRYPLLGSRLQNEVVYINPVADGTVIDYREDARLRAAADAKAWIERLAEAEVDVIVLGQPPPPEAIWVARLPAVFELRAFGERHKNVAFSINRERLRELVATGR